MPLRPPLKRCRVRQPHHSMSFVRGFGNVRLSDLHTQGNWMESLQVSLRQGSVA